MYLSLGGNMTELPNFDQMMQMAKEDPQQLERVRQQAINDAINNASSGNQNQLRSLQHRIDRTIERASNPYQSMIEVSNMMHEKLSLLDTHLNRPEQLNRAKVVSLSRQSQPESLPQVSSAKR